MAQFMDETHAPVTAALQAASLSGLAGVLVGGTLGIAQRKSPIVLWTLVSAVQWSLLGGSFWGIRSALFQHYSKEEYDPAKRVWLTAASGGISFALVGAVTRGRKNVLPGTLVGSFVGFAGQTVYNIFDRRHTTSIISPSDKPSRWTQLINSKWSPVQKLNDDDYANILKERLLRVEAEIALIDEELEKLNEQGASKESD